MNNETGKFISEDSLLSIASKLPSDSGRMDFIKRHTMFTLGEVITVKEQPFILQAITDDCLILIPKAKHDAMK